ncbi:MAG: response regulator [Phycisphaerae bacterium]
MARVLVVDDEEVFRAQLEVALRSERHEVATAGSGREGVDVGVRYHPEVLVTDWMLKNHINGLHLADMLRSVSPDLQAILITGFASDDLRTEAAEMNVFAFIEKPFRRERIQTAVHQAARSHPETPGCAGLAMLELGSNGTIVFANEHAKELLGETEADVNASNFAELFAPDAMPSLDEAADHWVVARPCSRRDTAWHIRSQTPPDGSNRLVVLRRRSDAVQVGGTIVEMLLGLREPRRSHWPFEGRVLILDDKAVLRRMSVSLLEGAGAGCYSVQTTGEAVRLLTKDNGIKFVIHDYNLPGITARESIETIKATRPDVLIIGTSGGLHRKDFSMLGVDHYLRKPWQVKTLVDVVFGRLGECAECGLELPLRRARPGEEESSWACAFCRSRYRGVSDSTMPEDLLSNARRADL